MAAGGWSPISMGAATTGVQTIMECQGTQCLGGAEAARMISVDSFPCQAGSDNVFQVEAAAVAIERTSDLASLRPGDPCW